MPGKSDIPVEVQAGDPLSAAAFNPLFQLAKRVEAGDGGFLNGVFNVRRRIPQATGDGPNVIHGLAVGAVTGSDFTIDNVQLINGIDPRDDPEDEDETVEIENPFGFDVDDNGLVRAEQADDDTWIAVQARCPE